MKLWPGACRSIPRLQQSLAGGHLGRLCSCWQKVCPPAPPPPKKSASRFTFALCMYLVPATFPVSVLAEGVPPPPPPPPPPPIRLSFYFCNVYLPRACHVSDLKDLPAQSIVDGIHVARALALTKTSCCVLMLLACPVTICGCCVEIESRLTISCSHAIPRMHLDCNNQQLGTD